MHQKVLYHDKETILLHVDAIMLTLECTKTKANLGTSRGVSKSVLGGVDFLVIFSHRAEL